MKTRDYLQAGTVFVPANEVDAYRAAGAGDVVGVPLKIRGITATRNWILDNAGDRWVVFVDDDLERCGWIELLETRSAYHTLTPAAMVAEWVRLFDLAEAMGLRVWGVSNDGTLRSVYTYRPFIFRTYVTASCMGVVNRSDLRFDESFPVKEDYELCLRVIREDGAVLGARYLYWLNSHWKDPGGCREYRTQAMEREAIARLQSMYPGQVRRTPNSESEFSVALDF